MNVLKLEQREEVISFIEKQLKEQHDFAKDNIDPVKRCSSHYFIILFSNILNKMTLVFVFFCQELEELRNVMDITKQEQSKKLAERHER